jgi:type I restriction enzyme R subunit
MATPEDQAREKIDAGLRAAGWLIQDPGDADWGASRGVAIRDFPLERGYGFSDYLLFLDGKAAGVLEAKKVGSTLCGVDLQSEKYRRGLPLSLPLYTRPLPFLYQSTGEKNCFTNRFDPKPRSRTVFSFHRPETLLEWLEEGMIEPTTRDMVAEASTEFGARGRTFHERMRINMPPLILESLWPAQIQAIKNLEQSLRAYHPRALIQMATGSGKTFTAINFIYRLIKFAGVRRVLFLVDGGNFGKKTLKAFQSYVSPYNNTKFSEEYIVQHLRSNVLDLEARVCISTLPRIIAILKGRALEEAAEHLEPIVYNPSIPIETFDLIVTDDCRPSLSTLEAQVLEYFDAPLIGLTANPDKRTIDFFNQNLLMDDGQGKGLSDGLNIISDVR